MLAHLYFCFIWVLYVGTVERSTLLVAVCVPATSVSFFICVCIWDTHSALLLIEHTNRKAAATSMQRDRTSPSIWTHCAGLQWPGRKNPCAWSWWRCWSLIMSLNNWIFSKILQLQVSEPSTTMKEVQVVCAYQVGKWSLPWRWRLEAGDFQHSEVAPAPPTDLQLFDMQVSLLTVHYTIR